MSTNLIVFTLRNLLHPPNRTTASTQVRSVRAESCSFHRWCSSDKCCRLAAFLDFGAGPVLCAAEATQAGMASCCGLPPLLTPSTQEIATSAWPIVLPALFSCSSFSKNALMAIGLHSILDGSSPSGTGGTERTNYFTQRSFPELCC